MATKQEEDLRNVVDYARNRKEVDCKKIVLWGTSAAGGYGLVLAAENPAHFAAHVHCPTLILACEKDVMVSMEAGGYSKYHLHRLFVFYRGETLM
jgi:dienelactone hydrolase